MNGPQVWGDFEFTPDDEQSLIGTGGFSKVYRARQRSLGRYVALKVFDRSVLTQHPGALQELLSRFQNEARIIARLKHPNIVTAHQFGESGSSLYLAMEYVEGDNLHQHLKRVFKERENVPEEEIVRIALKIVAGLQAAFDCRGDDGKALRIIHRDIKPTNILIGRDGEVKITDFGLARLVRGEGAPATSSRDAERVTKFGTEIGTPQYMAPEAFDGLNKADHRSDIYSLGILIYEMATHATPFRGTWDELRNKHSKEPVDPPNELRSDLGQALNDVIMRCVEKRPANRFQDYDALERDLRALLARPQEEIPAPIPRRNRTRAATVAVAIILILGALGVIALVARPDANPRAAMVRDEPPKSEPERRAEPPSPNIEPKQEEKTQKQNEPVANGAKTDLKPVPETPAKAVAKPGPNPWFTMIRRTYDYISMAAEFEVARRKTRGVLEQRQADLARRDFSGVVSELKALAQEPSANGWRKRAFEFETERFERAEQLLQTLLGRLKNAGSKEIALHLGDGTSLSGQVMALDRDKAQIAMRIGGLDRVVKIQDLHPRSFIDGASESDCCLFLHADRQFIEALALAIPLAAREQRFAYHLVALLEDSVGQAHRFVRERGQFGQARSLRRLLDQHPKIQKQLSFESRRVLGLVERELEAIEAFDRGDDASVAGKFPGTIAFKRLAGKLYMHTFQKEGASRAIEIDDLEHWVYYGPPGHETPGVEPDAGGLAVEQKKGLVWCRHTSADWSKGFEIAFCVTPGAVRSGMSLLLHHDEKVERQFAFDAAKSEVVLVAKDGSEEKILARHPIVGFAADKTYTLSAVAAHGTVFLYVQGSFLYAGPDAEQRVGKDVRIGVRNARLRIREVKVPGTE